MENSEEIEIITSPEGNSPVETVDVFNITPEQAKKLSGVSPTYKRRITQKFLRGQDGAKSKQKEYFFETSYDVFEVAVPPYNLSYLAKLYEISAYHHAAVDAKVSNIVGLGYHFEPSHKSKSKMDRTSDEDKVERMRSRLAEEEELLNDLLEDFNEEDLFIQTLEKVLTDYEVTGNGYLEIGRTTDGEIGYVGHIPATHMRVRLQRDGFVQIVSNKFTFFRNYGDTTTPDPISKDPRPNEVIHFKKYSPTNTYYGVPDIVSAKGAIAGNEFATRFNLEYFENKAVPRYIITLKGAKLNEANERKLLEFFETNLKGVHHRSLFIPLPASDPKRPVEFKLDPVENKVTDASFDQYQRLNRDEILMSHRVPISKIGIPDGVSLAMARDADKTFKEQVCNPIQRAVEKKINKIIKEFTDTLKFKLNELTLTDEDTQSSIDERYLRMQTITPNEVRARKGMPGLPNGDEPIQLNAQNRAEQAAQARQSRTRDQERSSNATDSAGEARNPKGEGRTQD